MTGPPDNRRYPQEGDVVEEKLQVQKTILDRHEAFRLDFLCLLRHLRAPVWRLPIRHCEPHVKLALQSRRRPGATQVAEVRGPSFAFLPPLSALACPHLA